MENKLRQRLTELEQELQKGKQRLADLQAQESELQQTLLRISGAIQVVKELIAEANASPPSVDAEPSTQDS